MPTADGMRVLVVMLALLAGCLGGGDPSEPTENDEATVDPLAAPPSWQVGQWWTYRLSTVEDPITWVVTEDAGEAWVVDVDHAEFRFVHDAFAQISTVGAIGKSDLQGSQEDGPIRFLDFPLEMNKTWDLTWDGIDWQASVVDVADGTAEVRAEGGAGAIRSYVYDADVGWFRSMAAYDLNGTKLFEATWLDQGVDYTGDYVRWTVHDGYVLDVRPGAPVVEMFDVPDDASDIWFTLEILCDPGGLEGDQGAGSLSVQPESGQGGIDSQDVCPLEQSMQGTLEAQAGDWGVAAWSGGVAYQGMFLPRTLETYTL